MLHASTCILERLPSVTDQQVAKGHSSHLEDLLRAWPFPDANTQALHIDAIICQEAASSGVHP